MHIYNWIAMPSMTASGAVTSVTNGFGDSVVGYGYSMVGTATTDCAVSAIVDQTNGIFSAAGSGTFTGGQYQTSVMTVTSVDTPTATISSVPVWGKQGPGNFATTTGTAVTVGLVVGISLAAT